MLFSEKAVEICPENGLYHYRLASVYTHHDQPRKALLAFDKAVKMGYPAEKELATARERMNHHQDGS